MINNNNSKRTNKLRTNRRRNSFLTHCIFPKYKFCRILIWRVVSTRRIIKQLSRLLCCAFLACFLINLLLLTSCFYNPPLLRLFRLVLLNLFRTASGGLGQVTSLNSSGTICRHFDHISYCFIGGRPGGMSGRTLLCNS